MKRFLSAIVIILAWSALVGMGRMPDGEAPKPKMDFRVTVVDDQEITTKCTNASWEGEVFFKAERGKGVITVPFEKVKKITKTGPAGAKKVDFQMLLKTGETIAVTVDAEARLYGLTTFGTYRILAKNIKEVDFE